MEDIEREIQEQAQLMLQKENAKPIHELINKKVEETGDVKTALDLFATKTALEQPETLDVVVEEKQEELQNDAKAKRVQAETERIAKEVEKAKREKEKELAELDRVITIKKAEVEHLKAKSDIEQAYFDSNKEILKYVGVRTKKTLTTMKTFMYPASIIFIIVQILIFPLTFCGLVLETIVGIVGGVCGAIKNHALKIILTVFVIIIVATAGFVAYYLTGKYVLFQ